jgi:hypothetical protein
MTSRADPSTVDTAAAENLQARLSRLARTQDPARIAALSTELLETLRTFQLDTSAARDAAVLELHESGSSLNDIARHAGLTRGRVFQIVQRGRADAPSTLPHLSPF